VPLAAHDASNMGACEYASRYDTVPEFLKSYGEGLQDKLKADDSGASSLVTLLYNETGPLNSVIEIWRHQVTLLLHQTLPLVPPPLPPSICASATLLSCFLPVDSSASRLSPPVLPSLFFSVSAFSVTFSPSTLNPQPPSP